MNLAGIALETINLNRSCRRDIATTRKYGPLLAFARVVGRAPINIRDDPLQ
jgi:hypothetical protein